MKKILAGGLLALLMTGCGGLYHTRYPNSNIRLGESKHSIIEKYGRPYSEELLSEHGVQTEILTYKEGMAYGYRLKTSFYFQNDVLVKKIQSEENPSKVVVCDEK